MKTFSFFIVIFIFHILIFVCEFSLNELNFEGFLFSPLRIWNMQLWSYAVHSSLKVLLSACQSGAVYSPSAISVLSIFHWAFFVRCLSYCCHTSCQERCSRRGNDNTRLCLAWPWSYISCGDDRGGTYCTQSSLLTGTCYCYFGFNKNCWYIIEEGSSQLRNKILDKINYKLLFITYYIFGHIFP